MNPTKALSQLGFVTGRGLDNGELGALLLSNKVKYLGSLFLCFIQPLLQTSQQIHDMEEKRRCFIKFEEIKSKDKKFKSTEQLERETTSKWCTSKVREELCLIHEAYQFFRLKYKNRYGTCIPSPNKFMK